ncbi:MAG: hypothetical protein ACK49I_00910 [Verrucomicrobiota bacterium]
MNSTRKATAPSLGALRTIYCRDMLPSTASPRVFHSPPAPLAHESHRHAGRKSEAENKFVVFAAWKRKRHFQYTRDFTDRAGTSLKQTR